MINTPWIQGKQHRLTISLTCKDLLAFESKMIHFRIFFHEKIPLGHDAQNSFCYHSLQLKIMINNPWIQGTEHWLSIPPTCKDLLAPKIIHFSHLFMRKFHYGIIEYNSFPYQSLQLNLMINIPRIQCLQTIKNHTTSQNLILKSIESDLESMNKYNTEKNHPQIQVHQKQMHRSNHNQTLNRNRD